MVCDLHTVAQVCRDYYYIIAAAFAFNISAVKYVVYGAFRRISCKMRGKGKCTAADEKGGNALARLSSTLIGLPALYTSLRVLSASNAPHRIIGQTQADIYASVMSDLKRCLHVTHSYAQNCMDWSTVWIREIVK